MQTLASLARFLPGLWISLLMLPSFVWVVIDRRVWAWDPGFYGYWTLKLVHTLSAEGFGAWLDANVRALVMMPPLLVWLGQIFVPLRHVFGDLDTSLMMLNLLAATATLATIYVVVRRLGGSMLAGLAAMTVCGSANLFLGLTRHFLTEPLQGFAAAFSVLVALDAEKRSLARNSALVMLMVAMSFAIKATSFIFVLPALTYMAVALLVTGRATRPRATPGDLALLATGVVVLGATLAWYIVNWAPMVAHFVQASIGPEVQQYRTATPYLQELWFWIVAMSNALSVKGSVTGVLVVAVLAAFVRTALRLPRNADILRAAVADHGLFGAYLASTVGVSILAYAVQINHDPRYALPLIPLIAVLAGWACMVLRHVAVPAVLLVVFTLSGVAGNAVTFGYYIGDSSAWLWPVERTSPERAELTAAVAASCRGDAPANAVVASYPSINANNASFYAERHRLETGVGCVYQSPPMASVGEAMAWFDSAAVGYVLTVAADVNAAMVAFANPITEPLSQALAADPRYVLASEPGARLLVYRRVGTAAQAP